MPPFATQHQPAGPRVYVGAAFAERSFSLSILVHLPLLVVCDVLVGGRTQADAAVFVRKFNGLSLPQHGVLKALFLVDSRTIRDSPAIQTAEEDGEVRATRSL